MLTEKFIKSSPASKVLFSVSTIIIVTVAAYNWVVSPQTSHLHAAQRHEVMLNSAEKKTEIIKQRLTVKETELLDLRDNIAQIKDSFFTPKTAREFFIDLEPISFQCGCNIDSLTFLPTESVESNQEENNPSSVRLERAQLSLTGHYDNIIEYFKKLSSYSERIAINDLFIESIDARTKDLVCAMTITIYLIEDKENISDE